MTYQELCSFGTLWTAYHRARRCKRGKKSTAPFEYSAIEELLILSKSLLQGTHQPDPLDAFYIYEPKKRLIQAPTFRDKVVQHALSLGLDTGFMQEKSSAREEYTPPFDLEGV